MKIILILLFALTGLFANDKGVIYGKVTLYNGTEYKGAIRWGKGYGKEHFWMDSFNSNKIENEFEEYVDYRDFRDRKRRSFFGIRFSSKRDFLDTHQFECYFGDIKKIIPVSRSHAEVVLKNNERYEVSGSDAGATIYILDEDSGDEIEVKWRRIEEVEFMKTPEKLRYTFGTPLHGTVETEIGKFTGLIQWDYDESLKEDELEGDDNEFDFSEIKSIEKINRRSVNVMLHNGKDYRMSGTNDVDDDNRGIVVKVPGLGTIEIQWREFESATFDEGNNSGPGYDEFAVAKKLYASVELESGETIKGRIAFDLDEAFDIETIDGEDDDVDFSIPIKDIKVIENTGRDASNLVLRSGKKLRLYDQRDVGEDNDGLLIWTSEDEDPKYVRWDDVVSITFE